MNALFLPWTPSSNPSRKVNMLHHCLTNPNNLLKIQMYWYWNNKNVNPNWCQPVGLSSIYDNNYLATTTIKISLVLSYDNVLVTRNRLPSDTHIFQWWTAADIYLHKYVFPARCRTVLGYLGQIKSTESVHEALSLAQILCNILPLIRGDQVETRKELKKLYPVPSLAPLMQMCHNVH